MSSPTLTRRALIAGAGASASCTALAVALSPAVLAADIRGIETAEQQISRLAFELSAVLTETYGGQFKATIGPHGDVAFVWAQPTPEQVLSSAAGQIRSAMRELGKDDYMVFVKHGPDHSVARMVDFKNPGNYPDIA